MLDRTARISLPFGQKIIADIEADYLRDGRKIETWDIIVRCVGLTTIDPSVGPPPGNRQYTPFYAQAGPEHELAEAIAKAATSTWGDTILNVCREDAEAKAAKY